MNGKATPRFSLRLGVTLAAVLAACGGGEAESDGEGTAAAVQSDAARIVACDLITAAEVEAMLGSLSHGPDSDEADFGGMNVTGCTFLGTKGMVMLRTWHPFSSDESTSAAWAARVQAEREEAPGPEAVQAVGEIKPYEGLGVPAALEDSRAEFGMVALHTMKHGKGGVYLMVTAPDPDIARAATEKALARIP